MSLMRSAAGEEAVALRTRYTKYSNNLMKNLLYLTVLLRIGIAPFYIKRRFTWE